MEVALQENNPNKGALQENTLACITQSELRDVPFEEETTRPEGALNEAPQEERSKATKPTEHAHNAASLLSQTVNEDTTFSGAILLRKQGSRVTDMNNEATISWAGQGNPEGRNPRIALSLRPLVNSTSPYIC